MDYIGLWSTGFNRWDWRQAPPWVIVALLLVCRHVSSAAFEFSSLWHQVSCRQFASQLMGSLWIIATKIPNALHVNSKLPSWTKKHWAHRDTVHWVRVHCAKIFASFHNNFSGFQTVPQTKTITSKQSPVLIWFRDPWMPCISSRLVPYSSLVVPEYPHTIALCGVAEAFFPSKQRHTDELRHWRTLAQVLVVGWSWNFAMMWHQITTISINLLQSNLTTTINKMR